MLPALAKLQDDADGVRRRYLRAVGAVSLLIGPSMFLLACVAEPMLETLYGDKWAAAVPIVTLLAPAAMLETLASTVGVLYLLHARTGLLFTWTLVSGSVIVGAYWVGAGEGSLQSIAVATTIAIAALTVPAFALPFRFSGHKLGELFRVVAPSLGHQHRRRLGKLLGSRTARVGAGRGLPSSCHRSSPASLPWH